MDRRTLVQLGLLAAAGQAAPLRAAEEPRFTGNRDDRVLRLFSPTGHPIIRYVYDSLPEGEPQPSVEGVCFSHPVQTPSGVAVTDLAPKDHPHHRGIFCAWVQIEGEAAGDWWGWGAKAPKEKRLILNREARITGESEDKVAIRLINSWRAAGQTVLAERTTITVSAAKNSHVLDYEIKLVPPTKQAVTIAVNPFGGFCYRAAPRGAVEVSGPGGIITTPDSVFDKSATNWPPSRWYDLTYRGEKGVSGVAILDHPENPGTTWHVNRSIHMLNPCINSDAPVRIPFGEPLYLKYRVVAHDGDAASADLDTLYERMVDGK